jgi:cobalt-zinc-cadmium efflux system protein
MGAVAFGGLLVNVAGAFILRGHRHGLSVRAAYLHVLGDLLGSIGALAAAALIAVFGWYWADPTISLAIVAIIVFNAVRLVLESVNVLMEGVPAHLDAGQVRSCLLGVAGVCDVHDLHLWSLGGRLPLLTAHLVLDHTAPAALVLREATSILHQRFGIAHTTLQVEPPDFNIVQRLTSGRSE